MIRKEVTVSPSVIEEVRRIIAESKIIDCDDSKWPRPDQVGRQELEVKLGGTHVSFTCSKIGSLLDVRDSEDPAGLEVNRFLVCDIGKGVG